VARIPARVRTKLLAGFLSIVGLLIVLGAVGLNVLGGVNERTQELITLQRKIAAYRQVQHDTTNQLYGMSTALLFTDERMLDAALRQLNQFGYDLDRMAFVAAEEKELLGQVRADFERLAAVVKQVAELTRAGRTAEAREFQRAQSVPLADRLERQTNQLVNLAEADMVAAIDATERTYRASRLAVLLFALGSTLLALGLGYIISSALIEPVNRIEGRLRRIAAGDFEGRVEVANRDEFGALAANLNQTSEELGRLYREIEARTSELSESLQQQTATADVLKVISRSAFDLDTVLNTLVRTAIHLCDATRGAIWLRKGEQFPLAAHAGVPERWVEFAQQNPIVPAADSPMLAGVAAFTGEIVNVEDIPNDPRFRAFEVHKMGDYRGGLAVPLKREGRIEGVIGLSRPEARLFTPRQCQLVQTFADQAVIAIENVRLFEEVQARTKELQESLEYQTATSDVLGVISRSPSELQPVLDAIARTARRLCQADRVLIWRLNEDGMYRTAARDGILAPEFEKLLDPIMPGRGSIVGRVALDRRAVHIDDIQADAEYRVLKGAANDPRRTMLGVPLLSDGTVIGVIVPSRTEARPFTKRQIDLVSTFADQAVIAINNVGLFDEVRARNRELSEALEQQTATSTILRAIAASPTDIQPVLDTVAESAARLCEAYDAAILLADGDALALRAHHGPIPIDFIKWPAGRDWVTGRAFVDRKPVHVRDLIAVEDEFPAGHAMATRMGHRTILAVPLLREDMAIGALVIRRTEVREFTPKQIDLLTTFADQAVIAIENVRLFEEVQARTSELARSVGELKALGEVSQAVNSTLDLKTVLETIVAKAVQLSETDAGAIYVYSKSADRFRLRATYGMSEELIDAIAGQTIGLHDAGIGEAARLRAPVQVADLKLESKSPVQQIVLDAGYRSVLVVPLLRPNKIVGALVVRRKTPGQFEDSTVHLLETFAAQSVLAIQNARLFSEIEEKGHQLEIASRHKSQFLANMSHELRTPLNSVLGFSEMLADGLYGELPEKAKATLARIQANGKHLLGLINDVLDLAKIEAGQLELVIDDYSAGQIVKSAAAATEPLARAKRLELKTVIAKGLPLGRGDERRLTQVLLNLAGNAVKFTDTGSVEIVAKARNGSFEFTVRDTGPGIAPEFQARIFEEFQQVDDSSTRKKGGTGLGLAISKRIVELHGGTIGVKSTPGAGSEFKVTIPVRTVERTKAA
jgi:signal transduction histidine kinase/HAMP domain-containing protein